MSYPPPTERMVCAGMMLMTNAATTADVPLPLHSAVRNATRSVATAPNHAGKKTQTSFRLIRYESPSALRARQMLTAVTCMPG